MARSEKVEVPAEVVSAALEVAREAIGRAAIEAKLTNLEAAALFHTTLRMTQREAERAVWQFTFGR